MSQTNLAINQESVSFNYNHLAGTIGMIFSPMLLVSLIIDIFLTDIPHRAQISSAFQLLYLSGWMCSAVGIRAQRAAGKGIGGGIIFVVQIIGLLLAMGLNVIEISQANPDSTGLIYQITDAAWPLSHLFMLVVGVAVVRAKIWRGWRRVTPFVCGSALLLMIPFALLLGQAKSAPVFGLLTTIGFMSLAYAVKTSSENAD